MIQLKEIITLSRVLVEVNITSKKRALEVIASAIAATDELLDEQEIFEQFVARERLGSTGFGKGVAIPHCRINNCQAPLVAVLKLPVAIDFDAIDEQPVDILIGLVVPEQAADDHLQLLKQIAELLSDIEICTQMREAINSEQLYQVIINSVPPI